MYKTDLPVKYATFSFVTANLSRLKNKKSVKENASQYE